MKIDSRNRCDKRTFFCFKSNTRFYHRIFLKIDVIIERFEHFRQNVIEFIKKRNLNIFDDDDDDIHDDNIYDDDIHDDDIYDDNIHDDDNENAKCVKNSIEIFEKF